MKLTKKDILVTGPSLGVKTIKTTLGVTRKKTQIKQKQHEQNKGKRNIETG